MQKFLNLIAVVVLLSSFGKQDPFLISEEISWETLANISLKEVWSATYKMKIKKPVFGASVKKLNGKMVSISGFLIPVTTYGNDYVISANPYAGCYFCGNAGIESIIELKFEGSNIRYKTDRHITAEGTLILNEGEDAGFIYTLQNAKEVK